MLNKRARHHPTLLNCRTGLFRACPKAVLEHDDGLDVPRKLLRMPLLCCCCGVECSLCGCCGSLAMF